MAASGSKDLADTVVSEYLPALLSPVHLANTSL